MPNAELVGLWNWTTERRLEKVALFRCKACATAEELLSDHDIEVVYLLTNMRDALQVFDEGHRGRQA
ncbi:MAG: hypothetical protein O3B01_25370 [Planctomycetota bacterium]|nr:hypothetical protein [Planctomycetota bacterium]